MPEHTIFDIRTETDFNRQALELYHHQRQYNSTYKAFVEALNPAAPGHYSEIPFLPVSFFKTHLVQTGHWEPEEIFTSSATTGTGTSRHPVRSLAWYESCFIHAFAQFYGDPSHFCCIALLPSYLERKGSSLVYMADRFIRNSRYSESGFYLEAGHRLQTMLQSLKERNVSILLLGVSFALWELAESFPTDLSGMIIMETGGMKGRRQEITRQELHRILHHAFQTEAIHSEYGMTELMSQAYSQANGIFHCPPWMKILTREIQDPFQRCPAGKTGVIQIIDLGNKDSCAFIETQDIGKVSEDGSFRIEGRMDNSDLRGCNLLVP